MNKTEIINFQKGSLVSKIIVWTGLAFMLLHQFKVLQHEAWETVGFAVLMLGLIVHILTDPKVVIKQMAKIGFYSLVAISLILYYIVYVRT